MPPATTRRVQILPDSVANQIAAGEVVERPASVVKELIENALDAGAHQIRVELEQGGKQLIIVSDDGAGMNRDDAILALDRHATSKITSAADLIGVSTFGFRGEAIPAIASVSRFTLATAEGDGDGTELSITGGRFDRVAPIARQRGTTITVRGLFFNTPARRKFLRSLSSEMRAAWEVVATFAIAHLDVGFELTVDAVGRLHVPAGQDRISRLASVWGHDLAATLIPVQHAGGAVLVEGLVQRPADARPTGRRAQLYVNGRPFRDHFLVRAAEAGYRSAIHPGDRPSLLLFLTVPGSEVDVNVHPAKLEVRFRERGVIEQAVEDAVRQALGRIEAATSVWGNGGGRASGPFDLPPEAHPARSAAPPADLFAPFGSPDGQTAAPQTEPRSLAAPVAQLFDTYIIFEATDGLVLVDQHSAHERVLYEQAIRELESGAASSQRLLLPITVELTDEELTVVETFGDTLRRIGFEVEPFGGRSVVLHAVPAPHPKFEAAQCFQEMVSDLARGRFGGWANRLERFAATYACRAAVKAGARLGDAEMRGLLLRLFETELPPHDVHGRSTIVRLTREELERRFGRR